MKYKKKKTQKKPALISPEIITGNRFTEIVKILENEEKLSPKERYLYGYASLRLRKILDALVIWWPLAVNKGGEIENDCASIAYSLFEDERKLVRLTLTDHQLLTLFYIARALFSTSNAYRILKQRLFDSLWHNRQYEKLEKIIKSSKDTFSSTIVENLSKLAYYQADKKLPNNPKGFASYMLTGGACLIARNPIYYNDIETSVQLLGYKIKQCYPNIQNTPKINSSWDRDLFTAFVDYESDILIQVLQLATQNQPSNLSIMPTPSYLTIYDPNNTKVGGLFLDWLAQHDKSLLALYEPKIYHLTFWALTGKGLSSTHNDIYWLDDSAGQYNPYLKFSLLLRSINEGKCISPSPDSIQSHEFTEPHNQHPFYRNVAIKTIEDILSCKQPSEHLQEVHHYILTFYRFVNDEIVENLLIYTQLNKLQQHYENKLTLDFKPLKKLVNKIKYAELKPEVEHLLKRSEQCAVFLRQLKKRNASKNLLNAIQSLAELNDHITLIADSCYLQYEELSEDLYFHIAKLAKNKKINTLFPLKETIDDELDCACANCQHSLYRSEIPQISSEMNLSTVSMPDLNRYKKVSDNKEKQLLKLIPLVDQADDPFEILGVDIGDDKKTVMKKVMVLMGEAPQKMATFRHAQTIIFNPATRFVTQYFHFLAYDPVKIDTSDNTSGNVNPTGELNNIPLRKAYFQA